MKLEKKVNHEEAIQIIKLYVASVLSEYCESLENYELPKIEDYNNDVEYQEQYKKEMLEIINEVESTKKSLFISVLNSYNQFLTKKNEIERLIKNQNDISIQIIDNATSDLKRTGIMAIALTVLFPGLAPFIIVINIPRIGMDYSLKKNHNIRIMRNSYLEQEFKRIQIPFFDFTDILREDYHKSMKEIQLAKQKLLNGEEVIADLLKMMNPERVHLEKIDPYTFIEEMSEKEILLNEENKPKQYKKLIN